MSRARHKEVAIFNYHEGKASRIEIFIRKYTICIDTYVIWYIS